YCVLVSSLALFALFCFFHAPGPTGIYPLSLHDALPISAGWIGRSWPGRSPGSVTTCTRPRTAGRRSRCSARLLRRRTSTSYCSRSEEHTSELQSRENLVCRLLLEKKNKQKE